MAVATNGGPMLTDNEEIEYEGIIKNQNSAN